MTIENQPTIYRSAHPDVIAGIDAEELRHADWSKRVIEWRDRHSKDPEDFGVSVFESGRGKRVAGLRQRGGKLGEFLEPSTPGWRFDRRKSGIWVPAKRTPEGKAIAEEMKGLELKDWPQIPGMPREIMSQLPHWYQCGLRRTHVAGEAIWVTWSCSYQVVDAEEAFNGELWERALKADYDAALAAEPDPEAVDA